jgi:hypothetical protein
LFVGLVSGLPLLSEHKVNEFVSLFEPDSIGPDNRVQAFVNDMVAYQLQNVAQFAATDPYWAHVRHNTHTLTHVHQANHATQTAYLLTRVFLRAMLPLMQVGLLLQQLQGIYEGYSAQNGKDDWALSFNDLVMLQLDGDMSDIQSKVWPSTRVDPTDPLSRILTHLIENSHCSALVKLTNSTDADIPQELFAAHDTWAGYSSTHRMYKAYNLSYSSVATTTLSFSSYPGYLTSVSGWVSVLGADRPQGFSHGHAGEMRLSHSHVSHFLVLCVVPRLFCIFRASCRRTIGCRPMKLASLFWRPPTIVSGITFEIAAHSNLCGMQNCCFCRSFLLDCALVWTCCTSSFARKSDDGTRVRRRTHLSTSLSTGGGRRP